MAKGINKVILIGNLGAAPETRPLPNGNVVTNINLATNDSWKDKQTGQQQSRTEWHRIVFFGKVAEIAAKYLKKGSQCYIEGRLKTHDWEKDGIKRYTTEIVVDMTGTLQLLGGPDDVSPSSIHKPSNHNVPTSSSNSIATANDWLEEDFANNLDTIPF